LDSNRARGHLPLNFQSSYVIHYQSEDSRARYVVIQVSPQMCWLLNLEWLANCWTRGHIFLKQMMPFCCPFLDPHLTTYHSHIGVHNIIVLELGMSILVQSLLKHVMPPFIFSIVCLYHGLQLLSIICTVHNETWFAFANLRQGINQNWIEKSTLPWFCYGSRKCMLMDSSIEYRSLPNCVRYWVWSSWYSLKAQCNLFWTLCVYSVCSLILT
jgi:hypothetical protein